MMTLRYIIIYSAFLYIPIPVFCCTFPQLVPLSLSLSLTQLGLVFFLFFCVLSLYFVYNKLRIRKCCYVYINI